MDNADSAADNPQMPEVQPPPTDTIALKILVIPSNWCPFKDWYKGLKDRNTRKRIDRRLLRIRAGNFGDFKPVGGEVCELRLDFGPGYRIYLRG